MSVHPCICVYEYVCGRVPARVYMGLLRCVHVYINVCVHVYIYAYSYKSFQVLRYRE
jgi:hypothetical protein